MDTKNYKLDVIWKSAIEPKVHQFKDKSVIEECIFYPWLKLERWKDTNYMKDWKYELMLTTSNYYSVASDTLLEYAYEHGIRVLSDCLVLTSSIKQLQRVEDGLSMHPDTIQRHKETRDKLTGKPNVINFNFNIYESIESREARETVQEVRPNA